MEYSLILEFLESMSLAGVERSGVCSTNSTSVLDLGLLGGIISCFVSRSIFSTSSLEFGSMLGSFSVEENTGKTFQQKTKLTTHARRR